MGCMSGFFRNFAQISVSLPKRYAHTTTKECISANFISFQSVKSISSQEISLHFPINPMQSLYQLIECIIPLQQLQYQVIRVIYGISVECREIYAGRVFAIMTQSFADHSHRHTIGLGY